MLSLFRAYLLCAIAFCTICTFIISYNCSCDIENPVKQAASGHENERSSVDLPETFLLIGIMSGPNETEARSAIRETWLKLSAKGPSVYRYFFPIGTNKMSPEVLQALEKEQDQYNDIVLLSNLEENYQFLAKKTKVTMEYAYQNFQFSYFLKIDSDSFVRIGAFIKALKDIQHPRLYWGFLDGRAKPIRKGKWKESDWILCDRYLPYQLGGGYVLSFELVRFIAVNSKLLKSYKNEDVSVGAWLAGLDVKYVHDPRFDTEWVSRGCNNEYLITHKKTPSDMRHLFQNLYDRKFLCEKEFRTRWSYVYDWSAVPSECCKRLNGSMVP